MQDSLPAGGLRLYREGVEPSGSLRRWKLVRERYDDSGFSGGSMERPALQKLLDDVRARKIDVIVSSTTLRIFGSRADPAYPDGGWH